jgi:hypothetical protein
MFTRILDGLSLVLVRAQFSDCEVTGSVLDSRNRPMAAGPPRSTAVEHSPRAAPAVAGAVLMLVLLLVLGWGSRPDIQLECP